MSSTIPGKLLEGVFKRVLAPDLTPSLISELAANGVDLSVPLAPTYPRTTWYRAIELTGQALFPSASAPTQQRRLGAHLMHALQRQHLIKGPWLSMARLMGPRRALKQAMDFVDRSPVKITITERSKHEFAITADEGEQPEFLAGLLEAALGMLGAKSPVVTLERQQDGVSHFRATWS
jgi:uncharacterized protein (TIGR02265 family)